MSRKKKERTLSPDDALEAALKESPLRQALKKAWQDSNLPGKITTHPISKKVLWNRLTLGVRYKGPNVQFTGMPPEDQVNAEQKELIGQLFEQFGKDHLKAVRICIRAIHLFTIEDGYHLCLQFQKSNSGLISALKSLEKWIHFKKIPLFSLHTITWEQDKVFSFSKENIRGKMPWRTLMGEDFLNREIDGQTITTHFQQGMSPSFEQQSVFLDRFQDWMRPRKNQRVLFWNPSDSALVVLAAKAGSHVEVFQNDFALRESLKIQRTKKQISGYQIHNMDIADYRKKLRSNKWDALAIESHEKLISAGWFEELENAGTRKVLRIYPNLNQFAEEARAFRKHGWMLLKVTTVEWSHRKNDFQLIALFTPGNLKELAATAPKIKSSKAKPAKGGLTFTQD